MGILDLAESHAFWKQYEDPMIYRVIAFLETGEKWTLDGDPALEAALRRLGDTLSTLEQFELGKEELFVALCAHIKSSRILRLLQFIDTIDPGSASKLLMYAEENNAADNIMANLFLRRNIAFERLRLLGRIFSEDRLAFLAYVLEKGQD